MSAYSNQPQDGPGQIIPLNSQTTPTPPPIEATLTANREQSRKLREDILALQTRHRQTFSEIDRCAQLDQARAQNLSQSISANYQAIARREQELQQSLQSQRTHAEELHRGLEAAIEQFERARTEMQHAFAQSVNQHRHTFAQREQTLRTELVTQQTRSENLQKDLERAVNLLEQTQTQARQAIARTIDSQQKAFAEKERVYRDEIVNRRGQLEALQKDLAQARSQLEAGAYREQSGKAELESMRAHQAQLQTRAAELTETCSQAQSQIELYKNSWTQVMQMERDARAHLAQKERHTQFLADAKQRIEVLEQSTQALQAQLTESQKELAASRVQLTAERSATEAERANASSALRAAEDCRARLEQSQAANAEIRRAADQAVAQTRTLPTPQPAEIEIRLTDYTDNIDITGVADIGSEFEKLSSARTHLETERDALKSQLAQAIQEISQIRAQYAPR